MKNKFVLNRDIVARLIKSKLVNYIYHNIALARYEASREDIEAILHDGRNKTEVEIAVQNFYAAWSDLLDTKGIPADYDYLIKLHKILMFGLNDSCKDQLSEEQIIELNTMINQPTKCNTEVALDVMMFILDRRLFSDGDVRTAMMFANKIMLEGGNGVIIINSYNRDTFRKKLKEYHNNHDSGLKNWLYQNCIQGVKTDDFGY